MVDTGGWNDDENAPELGRRAFMMRAGAGLAGTTTLQAMTEDSGQHAARHGSAEVLDAVLPDSMYTMYQLDAEEYVGTVEMDLSAVTAALKEQGYEYQPFSAKKYHPDDDSLADDGSYRLLDPDDPDKQWHVHLWETVEGVDVFSHYEYKPEFLTPDDEPRVAEHYRPDDDSYIQGQHSPAVKALLEERGEYAGDPDKCGDTALAPPTGNVGDILG